MLRNISCLAAVSIFLSACGTPEPPMNGAFNHGAIQVEPSRNGQILVIVIGGPVKNKGEHWFPEGTTLAGVLDWAGLDASFPPRNVRVVEADGHGARYRVADRPRKELERVRINHGVRVVVPWDRCFGFAPNKPAAPNPAIPAPFQIAQLRRGIGEREGWMF